MANTLKNTHERTTQTYGTLKYAELVFADHAAAVVRTLRARRRGAGKAGAAGGARWAVVRGAAAGVLGEGGVPGSGPGCGGRAGLGAAHDREAPFGSESGCREDGDGDDEDEDDVMTAADYIDAGCRVQPWYAHREEVHEMIDHAWRAYVDHAHPWDELKPLSCEGRRWDQRTRGTLDDSLGGFMTTAVDSLDTLALVGDYDEFRRTVREVVRHLDFDRDVTVSVFETNIRVLGGLLSAHMLLEDDQTAPLLRGNLGYNNVDAQRERAVSAPCTPSDGNCAAGSSDNRRNDEEGGHRGSRHSGSTERRAGAAPATSSFGSYSNPILGGFDAEPLSYNGELLDLALDLGNRLLPAFRTRQGLPYHRVNLKYGFPKGEIMRRASSLRARSSWLAYSLALWRSLFETAARRRFVRCGAVAPVNGPMGNINIETDHGHRVIPVSARGRILFMSTF